MLPPCSVEGVSVPPGAPPACTEAPSPGDRIGGRLPMSRPDQGPGSSSPRRRRPGCPDLVGHSANFKMALNWLSISENLNCPLERIHPG